MYVFGILPQELSNPVSTSSISFFIDGELKHIFTHTPDIVQNSETTFLYDQLLFSFNSLPHGVHNLEIQNGQTDQSPSLILFDYLIYTEYVIL